ncbi:mannosyltransferase putative-domain-containing protein [Globomyces pollinis-pini]|nr:mannosyltransferase putative-domain-containing protein [Globomyces pollinis-pini]
MRLFKQYNKKLIDLSKGNQRQEALSITKRIEKQLFGWVQPKWQTTIELYESYKGSGLVICMGNEQVRYALVTLEIIRKVFKFELPIEVFYMGDNDLSKENQETIKEKISDVKLVDITKLFDMNTITIGGWAIKPFAVLASSFEKVLMMDSDVIFLQSPQTLFDSKLFTTKGALFFHDRTLYSQGPSTLNWMYSLMPKPPSEYSGSLRTFRKQTKHEQESGVVLIDKRERFHGILATCLLNAGGIRRYTYDRVFGDKETFWLGMEMAQEEYTFNGHYPGNLGVSKKVGGYYQLCCRQILHFDENDSPIWYNGGMQEMKRIEDSPLIKVEDYWEETGSWELFEKNMACLKAKQPPLRFNPEFKSVISQSEQIAIELGMRHQSK